MSRIIISDDKSLENLDIRFDHLLLGSDELQQEKENFCPLEKLLERIPEKFFPSALVSLSKEDALATLSGDDELELFFLIILSKNRSEDLFEKLKKLKNSMDNEKYRDFLIFLFLHSENIKDLIIEEMKTVSVSGKDGIFDFILSTYGKESHEIKTIKGAEYLCATFFEAIKAEKAGNSSRAFSLMLNLFEKSGYHPFIFEILKFYLIQYDGIPAEQIEMFSSKVTESPLAVSYSNLKFIEFLYYYRNNLSDKLEISVSALAESTDSIFILNVIAPLLYKYQKWHLIGKFYKLSAKKTTGSERTKYLELLADIYENKLDMPDFATEIHKNIVEDDPMSCSVSLSRVLSVYEENGMWSELFNLYNHLAGREEDESLKAYYFYKAGDVLHRELGRSAEAREHLEKSLTLKHSFEVVRTLSEIYLKMHDYDAYIKTLLKELEFSLDTSERIRVLNIIAETLMTHKKDFISAQKYLLNILEIAPDHLPTIKKLGKIYYQTRSWKNLTEINFKEIDLTKDLVDTVNLYYRNGSIFFRELGDLDRATECFMEILEIEPDHIPSLLYLEKIYLRRKDISNLIILYKRLLEASHTDSETRQYYLTRLGIIYRDNNMLNESIDVFKTVLKMFPENIMAKENLRMLEGTPDFNNTKMDSYIERDLELFADLIKSGDASFITEQYLKRKDPSIWKYLYFMNNDNTSEAYKPQKLNSEEQFVVNLLERNYSIDNLIKNSSRKIALMLLVEKYLAEKYFRGIQTILKYYLKYEPEYKRKIWSLFFRGKDNPELKEELENILLNDSNAEQFDLIREILEKIYLNEGDFNTVLFLRNVFIKKIDDIDKKCLFIDSTIEMLTENIAMEQLVDLYRLRFKTTPADQLGTYTVIYENYLKSVGKTDLLTPLYENEWHKNHNTESGKKCFEAYLSDGNTEKAIETAREILNTGWDNQLFTVLINLLKKSGDLNLAISEVSSKLENVSEETVKTQLREMLLDLNIEAEYTQNAIDLFYKMPYTDSCQMFEKGLVLARLMNNNSINENSISLVRSLACSTLAHRVKKLNFLISAGAELNGYDFEGFDSYSHISDLMENTFPEKYKKTMLSYFSEKGDDAAKKSLINSLIKEGEIEEAAKLISTLPSDSIFKSVFLSKISWKSGDYEQEKQILKNILIEAIAKKEYYPLKRLLTLEKENRRLGCFLKSALKLLGCDKEEEEEAFPRIFALDKNELFNFAGFDELDFLIKEYLFLTSFGARDEVKMPGRPLNSQSHRNLIHLIEYIKLSANFDDLNGVWEENMESPFEIVPAKLPCIAFGQSSLRMDLPDLKFHVIRNAFLLSCGMKKFRDEKGLQNLAESIAASLKLTGKDKVRFVKSVRPNFQNRLLEVFNRLENVEEKTIFNFLEKLYKASFYHAFSLVPDIRIALELFNSEIENINNENAAISEVTRFINKYFIRQVS